MPVCVDIHHIGDFANSNKSNILENFQVFPKRVPSYSTIRREIKRVNFLNTLQNFNEWAKQLCFDDSLQKWVAIDGKSLRNTLTNFHNNEQNFISMISLFNQDNGIVLN
ncbi:MAG: hypothetical protein DSM107014_12490 [Gomphosphaeria aponina SAG 52.96 = DSM 107014]|uniref:Uncharacterized protein n=1 Tax=Gomphosphaeria aponina SAG 52.96 = DSM 107014 TaxID=1521640 RepID=A0A941GRW9_9CHRO|nr:hypothetical protein [Gomphosphaeria aponina SAG 52.96 = DSM 107014]